MKESRLAEDRGAADALGFGAVACGFLATFLSDCSCGESPAGNLRFPLRSFILEGLHKQSTLGLSTWRLWLVSASKLPDVRDPWPLLASPLLST